MTASSNRARTALCVLATVSLAACNTFGAPGPSRSRVLDSATQDYEHADIQIVDITDEAIGRLDNVRQSRGFAELLGSASSSRSVVGNGDVLEISIWEAPPAVLFGTAAPGMQQDTYATVARNTSLPGQLVGDDGTITVPFAGTIEAAGRTTEAIARDIRNRLRGRANDPQTIVRLAQNEARNVIVLGEVRSSRRVPLGPRGERLLDAIAAAGGTSQPVGKTTLQVTRGPTVAKMAMDAVIRDPSQNIRLAPDDVVTVLFQPYSFIALGAVNANAEVPFEGGGISLAQALGRIGGLKDERADIRGVFVFRLEDPEAFDPAMAASIRRTGEGLIPVIYRLDLSQGASLFAARNFLIRDKDVLYVSVAPGADLPKFISTLSNVAFTTIGVANLVN